MMDKRKGNGIGHDIFNLVGNNLFSNSNPNKYDKEEWGVPQLKWDNGLKLVRSNYSGPGTNVTKRL